MMYKTIEKIIGKMDSAIDIARKKGNFYKKIKPKEEALMDLVIEIWIENETPFLSIAHYGKLNGDLMRDPEIVCVVDLKNKRLIPIYFRNDYVGIEEYVHSEKRERSILIFMDTWARNLKFYGYLKGGKHEHK